MADCDYCQADFSYYQSTGHSMLKILDGGETREIKRYCPKCTELIEDLILILLDIRANTGAEEPTHKQARLDRPQSSEPNSSHTAPTDAIKDEVMP